MAGESDRCLKCGSCMRACPVMSQVGEGVFPGPRTLAVDCIREGGKATASMDELLKCSMCHACAAACPMRIDLPHALLHLRELSHDANGLRPGHARMVRNIDRYRSSVEPNGSASLPSDPTSSLCYFPGCIGRQRLPDLALSALGLISQFDAPASCPPELGCCGAPLEKIGDMDRLRRLESENLALLDRFDRIVASCPGCTGQLIERYHLDALHMVEYLYEDVGLARLSSAAGKRDVKVALHHPCHLNRLVGAHTKEYVVQMVQSIPGVHLVEYDAEEECCGAGGSLLSGFPDIADSIGRRKVIAASEAGADLLVTACPFCTINLGRSGMLPIQDVGRFIFSSIRR